MVRLGGKHLDAEGYDLLGLMTGSEGLLGVVTEVTVRILKKPQCARAMLMGFPSNEQAGDCVAAIIGNGIIPGGLVSWNLSDMLMPRHALYYAVTGDTLDGKRPPRIINPEVWPVYAKRFEQAFGMKPAE